jgi:hypothetical protein
MQTSRCLQEGPRGSLGQGHRRTSGADRTARRQTWRGLCPNPCHGARPNGPISRKWLNKGRIVVGNGTPPIAHNCSRLSCVSAELDRHEQPVVAVHQAARDEARYVEQDPRQPSERSHSISSTNRKSITPWARHANGASDRRSIRSTEHSSSYALVQRFANATIEQPRRTTAQAPGFRYARSKKPSEKRFSVIDLDAGHSSTPESAAFTDSKVPKLQTCRRGNSRTPAPSVTDDAGWDTRRRSAYVAVRTAAAGAAGGRCGSRVRR